MPFTPQRGARNARGGFSLIELLTVIAIIALLISILLPALSRAREIGRRTVCSANLLAITQGLLTYSHGNRTHFPLWGQAYASFASTGRDYDLDNDKAPKVLLNGVLPCISNTRNLWMLIHSHAGDPKTFTCPSDPDNQGPFIPADLSTTYDIQSRSQISYSYQWQGPGRDPKQSNVATNNARPGWNTSTRDDNKLVILADHSPFLKAFSPAVTAASDDGSTANPHAFDLPTTNPGSFGAIFVLGMKTLTIGIVDAKPVLGVDPKVSNMSLADVEQAVNSTNHRGEGQSFARLDGSVEFATVPWVGADNDNIYTVQDPAAYSTNSSSSPTAVDMLTARMKGLYDTTNLGEDGILNNWVVNPWSITKYPDSFLVP